MGEPHLARVGCGMARRAGALPIADGAPIAPVLLRPPRAHRASIACAMKPRWAAMDSRWAKYRTSLRRLHEMMEAK